MSKNEKKAIKRFYANWHEARKWKNSKRVYIKAFFIGRWCIMSSEQAKYLLRLLTKKDRKVS